MTIEENIIRIREGKNSIITSLQQKGSTISADTLINDIPQFIENLPTSGGGGGADLPSLEQKYEGATCFRIKVPTSNYEFSLNLCHTNGYAEYDIDWGDGIIEHLNTYEQHHTYRESGTYDINVYNISNNITLGMRFEETEYSYLFLNSNNLYWENDYVIKDFPDICTDVIIGSGIVQIGNYTFAHLNELKSIIINDGVTNINYHAFSYTPNLKTLVLPQTLTNLNMQEYIGIEELILPNSVTEISSIVECTYLKRVQFSDNLNTMNGGFNNTPSLEEVDMSNTQLTSLPSDCFNGCQKLKKVVLPNTITELAWQMFSHCKGLNYFVVPNGITRIEYGCFFYCENLLQVELPSTLTYINDNAFYYCNSLQYIISHALVAPQIESQTFYSENEDKHKYLYIHQNADIESYTSGYWGELLTKGWEIKYIEDIPTETTETTLKIKTKNNFPIKIDKIYFADLINRQLVDDEYVFTFDNSIDRLPKNIYPKNELIGITLPNTLQYISYEQFRDCNNLEYVDIPNSVVSIGKSSFYYCSNLTEITIPSSVTNIGDYCFYNCSNLSKIICKCMQAPILDTTDSYIFYNVPYEGILYIYEGAKGFDEVDSVWYENLVQSKRWKIEYMEIPQPNNEIWYTTTDGKILDTTYIVDKVTDNTLVSNTYENGQGILTFEKDFHEIPTNMFSNKRKIQTIKLPNSITILGESAFDYCDGLISISLPKNLTTIGKTCFKQCYALQEINLPDTITEIGSSAFQNCNLLEEVVLPPQITTIEANTFSSCTQLKNITIPSLVSSIGDYALASCNYLETITCLPMTAPTINNIMNFTGNKVPSEIQKVLLINEGAVGYDEGKWKSYMEYYGYVIEYIKETPNNNEILYKSADGNIINPTHFESLPTIVSNTYKNDMGIIVCESDISELGFECFDSNANLIEINLPSSVTYLAQWAFYGTANLHSITFNSIEAPKLFSESVWSNIGNTTSEEKVIRIPNNANIDSYINGEFWVSIYNQGYVLKNFNGELLYST